MVADAETLVMRKFWSGCPRKDSRGALSDSGGVRWHHGAQEGHGVHGWTVFPLKGVITQRDGNEKGDGQAKNPGP